MSLFVTGFGAFGGHQDNPSAWLAEHSGQPFSVLDVTYAAADRFVAEADALGAEAFLHIGLSARASTLTLELVGRGRTGPTPDNEGKGGPGVIDPRLPGQAASTLWPAEALAEGDDWTVSTDAGDYLCNWLLYRMLVSHPRLRVGFLHVPPFAVMPAEEQLVKLQRLLALILP